MLGLYLAVGVGVYLGAAAQNLNSFKTASKFAIAKGVAIGLFLWPVALAVLVTKQEDGKS